MGIPSRLRSRPWIVTKFFGDRHDFPRGAGAGNPDFLATPTDPGARDREFEKSRYRFADDPVKLLNMA
jgi:hypothetical protein